MARTNPLDLLRTAAREGVHAGVTVGGKALGHAATLARSGLVRGQAAVTAATARRHQPPATPPVREATDADEPLVEPEVEPETGTDVEVGDTGAAPAKTPPTPSPAEVAKRAQRRPTTRPPAKKATRTTPSGPGGKLPPPRRDAED